MQYHQRYSAGIHRGEQGYSQGISYREEEPAVTSGVAGTANAGNTFKYNLENYMNRIKVLKYEQEKTTHRKGWIGFPMLYILLCFC